MFNILTDASFWIALVDPKDQYHNQAKNFAEEIYNLKIKVLIPWPVLYEIFRTRFVRNRRNKEKIYKLLKKLSPLYIDDKEYRELALQEILKGKRALSLVDKIIRCILYDKNLPIHILVTADISDFQDICRQLSIEIWSLQE